MPISLEPVDDVMTELIKLNGPLNDIVGYLGRADERWLAVPATIGTQIQGPCSRIDLMKQYAGIDVQDLYPPGAPPKAASWTLDAFLKAAEGCHKAGFPFGIGLGTTEDLVVAAGVIFQCFGAVLVDANGKITVKSDAVRAALDYYSRLAALLPAGRSGLGQHARITNGWSRAAARSSSTRRAPGRWPNAMRRRWREKLWTHGMPAGPKGRFAPYLPFFWGLWSFSKNKAAAKSLLVHLSQPSSIERLVAASGGFDLPPFVKYSTLRTWAEEGPPKGTLYHYPNPHSHQIPVDRGRTIAAKDRRADFHPGPDDQDDRASHAGRADGKNPHLGGRRARRLHAYLDERLVAGYREARRASTGKRQAMRVARPLVAHHV